MNSENNKILEWLHRKLDAAKIAVTAWEQSAECWRGGTVKQSETEARILERCRHEVEMFRAVITALEK